MSLTVSGIVYINSEVTEHNGAYAGTTFFNFTGVGKDPYSEGRKFYRIAVTVPKDKVEAAKKIFQKGKVIQIRIGELDGKQISDTTVAMTVRTKWAWIEPLNMTPGKERQ